MKIPQDWMPKEMLDVDKQKFADQYPTDPHFAAAAAWESWGATLIPEPTALSVQTGAQSISYDGGWSAYDASMQRAQWHRSRSKVLSVAVGPQYTRQASDWEPVIKTEPIKPWYTE